MPPKRRINLKPHVHRKGAVYKKGAKYREHKKATFRPAKAKKAVIIVAPPPPAAAVTAAPRTTLPVEVVMVAPAATVSTPKKRYVAKKKSTARPMKSKIVKVAVVAVPVARNRHGQPAPPVPPRPAHYDAVVRVPPPLPVRRARAARTTLPVEVVEEVVVPPGAADPTLMQARRLPPAAELLKEGAAKLKKAAVAAKKVENTMANALQAAMDARRAAIAPVGNDVGGDSDGGFNDTVVMPAAAASSNIAYSLNDPDDSGPLVMPAEDEIGGSRATEVMADGEAMEGTGMIAALGMENIE